MIFWFLILFNLKLAAQCCMIWASVCLYIDKSEKNFPVLWSNVDYDGVKKKIKINHYHDKSVINICEMKLIINSTVKVLVYNFWPKQI